MSDYVADVEIARFTHGNLYPVDNISTAMTLIKLS